MARTGEETGGGRKGASGLSEVARAPQVCCYIRPECVERTSGEENGTAYLEKRGGELAQIPG
eukprot:6925454-Pyramimonas_sp.AAC.1